MRTSPLCVGGFFKEKATYDLTTYEGVKKAQKRKDWKWEH